MGFYFIRQILYKKHLFNYKHSCNFYNYILYETSLKYLKLFTVYAAHYFVNSITSKSYNQALRHEQGNQSE